MQFRIHTSNVQYVGVFVFIVLICKLANLIDIATLNCSCETDPVGDKILL